MEVSLITPRTVFLCVPMLRALSAGQFRGHSLYASRKSFVSDSKGHPQRRMRRLAEDMAVAVRVCFQV